MRLAQLAALATLALAVLAAPLAVEAQASGKVYRIGMLSSGAPATPSRPSLALDSFRARLRELGYVEGRNIAIEYRWAAHSGHREQADRSMVNAPIGDRDRSGATLGVGG